MVLRIRLALHGCKNRPFYHIVVANKKWKRDGKHFEQVGSYDPMPNERNEKLVALKLDRIRYWLGTGAQPTNRVAQLLGIAGILPVHPRSYLEATRNREARQEDFQEIFKNGQE
ncbi:small ribosomal subunit protein bS16m-like [Corticium candelabrum]|uniref:small ribosomal subunit protein bS16m-like n=1 Tax=Corticium candelabrum TaxID=121492 RepID=UPI002E268695|nr:small ribosomal subunit protein bS16m-like [Corticium candelabrum]